MVLVDDHICDIRDGDDDDDGEHFDGNDYEHFYGDDDAGDDRMKYRRWCWCIRLWSHQ